jgi:hypothetical protein
VTTVAATQEPAEVVSIDDLDIGTSPKTLALFEAVKSIKP